MITFLNFNLLVTYLFMDVPQFTHDYLKLNKRIFLGDHTGLNFFPLVGVKRKSAIRGGVKLALLCPVGRLVSYYGEIGL